MSHHVSYNKMDKHLERINKEKDSYFLSIILPVYNEDKTICSILNSLPNKDYIEIIAIDDKSNDDSICEIQKAQENRNIKLYKHSKNQGYGKAILTGIKNSKGKIIVTMDADGQHSPEDIYTLIKPILDGEADYTIGSRYLGTYHYKLPLSTRLGELFVEKLIQVFFRQRIASNQGGFRAIDRKIIKIFDNIQYLNYAFTTELIIRTILYGYKIKECPIKLMDRAHGKSRIILNKLALNLFSLILRYILIKIKMKTSRINEISFKKEPLIFKEIV